MTILWIALAFLGGCSIGLIAGWVLGFAAVRSAGYRLAYINHAWSVIHVQKSPTRR